MSLLNARLNQQGFAHAHLIVAVLVAGVIGLAGYRVFMSSAASAPTNSVSCTYSVSPTPQVGVKSTYTVKITNNTSKKTTGLVQFGDGKSLIADLDFGNLKAKASEKKTWKYKPVSGTKKIIAYCGTHEQTTTTKTWTVKAP